MKISAKIYCGFLVIILVMAAVVGYTFWQVSQITATQTALMEYELVMKDTAQKLALNTARQAAANRGYLATGYQAYRSDLDKATEQAAAAIKLLNENEKDPKLLQELNHAYEKFVPHLPNIMNMLAAGQREDAVKYLNQYVAADNAILIVEIENYIKEKDEALKLADESFDRRAAFLKTVMLAGLVLSLVLAAFIAIYTVRGIVASLRQGMEFADAMAKGDFTRRIEVTAKDEISTLLASLAQAGQNLRALVRQAVDISDQLAASAQQLTATADQSAKVIGQMAGTVEEMAQGAEQQVGAVNAATAVIEEMSASVQQVAANANVVAEASGRTSDVARSGGRSIDTAVTQMANIEHTVTTSAAVVAKLGERSKEIGQIVDTISSIAGQTNLLALNAAIEAARAGEQGRGFAVVAEEVRKLAEQSQEATGQIAALIGEIQGETDQAVAAMQKGTHEVKVGTEVVNAAGKAFGEIITAIDQVVGQIGEISQAIGQMAKGSQQIVGAVKSIDSVSRDIAAQTQTVSAASEEQTASTEEIASSSEALAKLSQDLQGAINKFKV